MGMEAYIFRARTKKVFDTDDWYNNTEVTEMWYARKFWDLINRLSFLRKENYAAGQFFQLTKDNLEEMIQIATHYQDYWGSFDSVPKLCEILYNFDTDEECGWHYYFEYDS